MILKEATANDKRIKEKKKRRTLKEIDRKIFVQRKDDCNFRQR